MTTYFVDGSAGSDSNAGTSWSVPFQSVAKALGSTTPTIIAVGSTGTFTPNAAITWTIPGTGVAIISATNPGSGTTITQADGATEAVGAASATFTVTPATNTGLYVFGMTLKGGTNAASICVITLVSNGASLTEFDTCTFDLPSVSSVNLSIGAAVANGRLLRLKSCQFNCTGSRTGAYFYYAGVVNVEIINPTISFTGASKPAQLFSFGPTVGTVLARDGDLSGFAGTAYVSVSSMAANLVMDNLKLNAAPTITSGSWTQGSGSILLRNCDSGNTTYVFTYITPYGTLTANTPNYLTGTSAQFNGAAISWKIVTTSVCSSYAPFRLPPIAIWDTTTTAQTASIEFAQDAAATALTDQDIWSDLDYAASASFPNYSWESNRNAAPITGTPANQPSSSATWTGLTTPTTQHLTNGFTAAATGLLQSVISIGKASTTLYINPWIDGVT